MRFILLIITGGKGRRRPLQSQKCRKETKESRHELHRITNHQRSTITRSSCCFSCQAAVFELSPLLLEGGLGVWAGKLFQNLFNAKLSLHLSRSPAESFYCWLAQINSPTATTLQGMPACASQLESHDVTEITSEVDIA